MQEENPLAQVTVHNIPTLPHAVYTLPEFQLTVDKKDKFFHVEPDNCSRSTQILILPTAQQSGRGRYGLHTQLLHALDRQKEKFYVAWWWDASSAQSLDASLLELCDALDPSGCVSEWGADEGSSLIKTFSEQQRVRGRCCVFVLDAATTDSLWYFVKKQCPVWGAFVIVLPHCSQLALCDPKSEPVSAIRSIIPSLTIAELPQIQCSDPYATDSGIVDARLLECLLPVTAASVFESGMQAIPDESYILKFWRLTAQRPLLLRLIVRVMSIMKQDSYEVWKDFEKYCAKITENSTCLKSFDGEEEVQAAAVLRQYFDALAHVNDCAHQHFLSLGVLSSLGCIPEVMVVEDLRHILIESGLALFIAGSAKTGCSLLSVSSWAIVAFAKTMTDKETQIGVRLLLERVKVLEANVLASGRPYGDALYYRLHDQMSLGVKRVLCGGITQLPIVGATVHVDAEVERAAGDMSPTSTIASPNNMSKVPSMYRPASYFSVTPQQWLRCRGRIISFLLALIHRSRLYFPDELLPIEAPSIKRPFSELSFGLPPLPDDETTWTAELGNLFRKYAAAYRHDNDFVNAAAASERALCVYLHFLDVACTAATAKFAALISPKMPSNAEQLLRRRSTAMQSFSRRGSRRSIDASKDDDVKSNATSGSQTLMRKMSRLTQMTHESNQSSRGGKDDELGLVDDQAYAHIFSLLMLAIEKCYTDIAREYSKANVPGIALPLLDRGIATLELLNRERRDTPARAMTFFRKGEKEALLSDMERRRAQTIKQAPELDEDEAGDSRLKALVRADVNERHHLRFASNEMKECLQVLEITHNTVLTAPMAATCHEIIARHYLSDVGDKEAAMHGEKALSASLTAAVLAENSFTTVASGALRMVEQSPLVDIKALRDEVRWAFANAKTFIRAIELNDYITANELLDRSQFLAIIAVVDDCFIPVNGKAAHHAASSRNSSHHSSVQRAATPTRSEPPLALSSTLKPTPFGSIVFCDGCGDLSATLGKYTFPQPRLSPHLHLWTNFSESQIAGHHGQDWTNTARAYKLPLLTLIRQHVRTDEVASVDATMLLRRLVEECHVNPLSCSPHDMKTALHVAVECGHADVVQYLLNHQLVDPMIAAPFILRSERKGLSTVPIVSRIPCPLPCPLLFCPESDNALLMVLLLGSKDPQFVFKATKVFLLERFAADRNRQALLGYLFDDSSSLYGSSFGKDDDDKRGLFAPQLQALIASPELCSETREALVAFAPRSTVLWGLRAIEDPHILLAFCDMADKFDERDALWALLMRCLDGDRLVVPTMPDVQGSVILASQNWTMAHKLLTRFPRLLPQAKLGYDMQRLYKKWKLETGIERKEDTDSNLDGDLDGPVSMR